MLDGTRLLDLKASLLMDDDRFDEALKLLDQAIAESRSDAARARLLLTESTALGLMGETERMVAVLRRAVPLIDEKREPRLLWVHRFIPGGGMRGLRAGAPGSGGAGDRL